MTPFVLRPAAPGDAAAIVAVVLDAGSVFRDVGMAAVSHAPPPPVGDVAERIRAGRIWVAVHDGSLVGAVVVRVVDGDAHIEQVSTARAHTGRGIGRSLVRRAEDWARSAGHDRVTLTTFTDVAWNAPYYRRLGYRVVPADELGPELAAVRVEEARSGLDAWGRCAMVRDLG